MTDPVEGRRCFCYVDHGGCLVHADLDDQLVVSSPSFCDGLRLLDSTPVPFARPRPAVDRVDLLDLQRTARARAPAAAPSPAYASASLPASSPSQRTHPQPTTR
jgi:hypothetical protein